MNPTKGQRPKSSHTATAGARVIVDSILTPCSRRPLSVVAVRGIRRTLKRTIARALDEAEAVAVREVSGDLKGLLDRILRTRDEMELAVLAIVDVGGRMRAMEARGKARGLSRPARPIPIP